MLLRRMRRKGGRAAVWARRLNVGSIAVGAGVVGYGAFSSWRRYHTVRALQLRVRDLDATRAAAAVAP